MTTLAAERAKTARCNIASLLPRHARERGSQTAVVMQKDGRAVTFAELDALCNRIAHGLKDYGFARGDKVVLAVPPSPEFFALTFALFKLGCVPVMIDPGMGRKNALACIAEVKPVALVGISLVHLLSRLFAGAFRGLRRRVTVGRRWLWGGRTLRQLAARERGVFEPADTRADELAAILFTSGATGISKGVEYEHGMFAGQVEAIGEYFGITPGEVDVPCFALFALFTLGMGCTVVIPDIDFSKPALADPAKIITAINAHQASLSFASPAVWKRISGLLAARDSGPALPSLRRAISAGASVSADIMAPVVRHMASGGDFFTPYGATESLPVSCIGASQVIGETAALSARGAGTCVGKPLPGVMVRIANLTRTRPATAEDPLVAGDFADCAVGEIGEILVGSTVTTRRYFNRPRQTAEAKVYSNAGRTGPEFLHRIGDVGYFDDLGRIWFCGRANHVVWTADGPLYPDRVEPVFNNPSRRTALAGVGKAPGQTAVLVVEGAESATLRDELLAHAAKFETTRAIKTLLFHQSLPVDVRHNAKIDRIALSSWAEARLGAAGRGPT